MTDQGGGTRWRLEVDGDSCIGSGMCEGRAPGHFTVDGGRSRPLATEVTPDEAVLDAAESCPMEAITVRDAVTGTPLAPQDLA